MSLAYPEPDLVDEVVRLRPWSENDLGCVREAAIDPRIPEGTTVPRAFTDEAGLAFIRRQWERAENGDGVSLAIAEAVSDEARGLLWLAARPQPGVVGVGYWVIPAARRRGLGRHAVRLAASWALGDASMTRVEAWVEPENTASRRVLESAGFSQDGLLRSFLCFGDRRTDALVFSRIAGDA
ncbi:MAG: GNAT family N-acetyltransferase [Actinomycetota bacterium]|nr:GNAT family N-acetyltransferase [Actinomycetota bacterium]